MALNLTMANQREELKPRITVFGVGGAGGNAVNNMIEQQLEGVEFVVANTDAQALQQSKAPARIQMGLKVTEGLGAGARPSVGAAAAEETIEEIVDHLAGSHMCFITAGMGGGTGTGAAPIIAQAARELGVLTVGVVTKPFQFEGAKRMRQADEGLEALQKVVDTLIIIPNQNLFRLANERTTFTEAFALADNVLYQGVKGISDLMVRPGLINLDFADVRSVMDEMGKAMMGTGEASGEDRAVQAAEKAIANPLLDEISLNGAKGVLINITGGYDLTLFELDEAANIIREKVDADANIIVGSTLDTTMEGALRVSVVATGIDASAASRLEAPIARRPIGQPLTINPEPAPVQAQRAAAAQSAAAAAAAAVRSGSYSTQAAAQAAAAQAQAAAYQPQPAQPSYQQAQPAAYQPQSGYQQNSYQQPQAYQQPAVDHYAEEDHSGHFAPRADLNHDLPPPAYNPQSQMQPAMGRQAPVGMDADPSAFVAPRPRMAGQPSAEALARLQAAVTKAPAAQQAAQPARQAVAPQPQPAAPAPRARFGIGSLINRMAGHSEPAPEPRQAAPVAPRQQPNVSGYDEGHDQQQTPDRNEIPAFLRRQAN